jgi:hypothetical protein
MAFAKPAAAAAGDESGKRASQLTHWPVQLHLIGPSAPHYQGADLLLAADCTAFALGDFHRDFLKGKALAMHLERAYSATFPGAKRRGLLARGSSDRGAEFLRGTHCPAVICEPFFGSNANEWREAKRCEPMLAAAIAKGLIAWAKEVQP